MLHVCYGIRIMQTIMPVARLKFRSISFIFLMMRALNVVQVEICAAVLLNSYEMAIGKWKLMLHPSAVERMNFVDNILFPPKPLTENVAGATTLLHQQQRDETGGRETTGVVAPKRKRRRSHSMSCCLTIRSDGTFYLEVEPDKDGAKDSGEECRLPLRGEWLLQSNPYCVTDRQYDTLILLTYPRVKRISHFDNQYAFLEFRCKLWGRYGMKWIRDAVGHKHGRSMGRLTHGTVLLIRREQHGDVDLSKTSFYVPKWRRRIVCGTFWGKPAHNDDDTGTVGSGNGRVADDWDVYEGNGDEEEDD
mmetsp:Transcript_2590/g.5474  ORF Transcript_2590/g.5474 Transcript_2590/m.5474 type:complete len:305 (+) Transcript_2590:183-1097(+)